MPETPHRPKSASVRSQLPETAGDDQLFSPSQLMGILDLCDPAKAGQVSVTYMKMLAAERGMNQEEQELLARALDPKGRGALSYREFFLAVRSCRAGRGQESRMLSQVVGRRDMMGPSLEVNCTPKRPATTSYFTSMNPSGDVTLSFDDSNEKLNCSSSMSDEESYECYGEVESDTTLPMTINSNGEGVPNSLNIRRNTWLRTSLRRNNKNPEVLPNRRWGSFRHSSGKRISSNNIGGGHLHRSPSFNSSGKSSTYDAADDVSSDVSLEEDLNQKVQMLQDQMNILVDNQNHSDERYTRAKQECATLQARAHMLEEQLREVEVRAEEKLTEVEKRHRELVSRVDRETQLQVENCAIRLQSLEQENSSLKEEVARCRSMADKVRMEKAKLEGESERNEATIASLKEEIASLRDQERKFKETADAYQKINEELVMEVEKLKSEKETALEELGRWRDGVPASTYEELQAQFSNIRDENRRLQEAHEEMQALLLTKSVEEGRSLLTKNKSLAAELEDMSQAELDDVRNEELKKMSTALKEHQEVIAELRSYIDGMLLNIVENYPQLLEVKSNP